MGHLRIGKTNLHVKDYECSFDEIYPPKESLRLWLYVNITNGCNANCPFCVSPSNRLPKSIDLDSFASTLERIEPYVSGVSITGGEPMLNIALLEETIAIIDSTVDPSIQLDLVTNGVNAERLPYVRGICRLATVHMSRHAADDEANRRLMGWHDAPSSAELSRVFANLPDPGSAVLNCVLQKGGVHDRTSAIEYLETATTIGAANVSFIGMIKANSYCARSYVSPMTLNLVGDERVSIWNHYRDHDFCQCSSGDYRTRGRYIRFYYRCPGTTAPLSYCRQLVYDADNVLRQGFGNAPIVEF